MDISMRFFVNSFQNPLKLEFMLVTTVNVILFLQLEIYNLLSMTSIFCFQDSHFMVKLTLLEVVNRDLDHKELLFRSILRMKHNLNLSKPLLQIVKDAMCSKISFLVNT